MALWFRGLPAFGFGLEVALNLVAVLLVSLLVEFWFAGYGSDVGCVILLALWLSVVLWLRLFIGGLCILLLCGGSWLLELHIVWWLVFVCFREMFG